MFICSSILTIVLFFVLVASDSANDLSESYKAIDKIAQAEELQDEEKMRAQVLALKILFDSLDKRLEEACSSIFRSADKCKCESVEQKVNNTRFFIEYTAFMKRFLGEKENINTVENSLIAVPADFTVRRSPDYTKVYIENRTQTGFFRGYFYTMSGLSIVYACPDADLNVLKQFLEEKECHRSVRDDILILLDGNFKRNRRWMVWVKNQENSFTGHLEKIDHTSVTIRKESLTEETTVVNISDLDSISTIFVYSVKPHFPAFVKINAFKEAFAAKEELDSEGLRKLFLFNVPYKGFRQWESFDKLFKVTAKFVSLNEDLVTLERADGKEINIELSVLRAEDQEYIRHLLVPVAELRTWRSAGGEYEIKATFVSGDETIIVLKREDDIIIRVEAALLSAEDQEYVKLRLEAETQNR